MKNRLEGNGKGGGGRVVEEAKDGGSLRREEWGTEEQQEWMALGEGLGNQVRGVMGIFDVSVKRNCIL